MRKRKFVGGIFALCLALSVAGCGKGSEEQQAASYYQNELGLDKEDAEELAHEIYGEDEEAKEPSATEEVQEETVIEPLPELVDSEWYERKVQILDMVFTRDEYLTEEVIREIVAGSAYDVELSESFDQNGGVCLDGIMLDGTRIAYLFKRTRSGYASDLDNNWYDKGTMEVDALDFKTRDDVLAYFAENGFVEVEEKQAPYANTSYSYFSNVRYVPNGRGAEFAAVVSYGVVFALAIYAISQFSDGKTSPFVWVILVILAICGYRAIKHLPSLIFFGGANLEGFFWTIFFLFLRVLFSVFAGVFIAPWMIAKKLVSLIPGGEVEEVQEE